MRKPTFTPLEAVALFGNDRGQEIKHDGFSIIMDGPMMSPSWAWAPQATKDGATWYVEGEPGDPIDKNTQWIGPYPC